MNMSNKELLQQAIKSLLRSAEKILDTTDITGTELANLVNDLRDHKRKVEELQRERDALTARLREIEQQEPVAKAILVGHSNPFWDFVLLDAADDPKKFYPGVMLYTRPAATPHPPADPPAPPAGDGLR